MKYSFAKFKKLGFAGKTKSGWGGDEILKRIINTMLLGLVAIVIFAIAFSPLTFLKIVSTGLLLAGATCISGAFLGFLFGIPRTNQIEEDIKVGNNESDKKNTSRNFKPNTNLEQISDWLTKILVGVGLTQIDGISKWFHRLLIFFTPYFEYNSAIVISIIIYFLVSGFILGFLWSRLYMAGAIMKAEAEALKEQIVKEVQNKVDIKEQYDAKALSVVNQLLDADSGVRNMSEEAINEIIAKASPVVKVTIFNQAQRFRKLNWKNEKNEHKIARTIPIFKALIKCDFDGKYHRNHGQLGFALKDQTNYDYELAVTEITKAIEIRDKTGKQGGWLLYEYNRAYCRIKINEMNNKEIHSKEDIYMDIQTASKLNPIKDIISREPVFTNWLKKNNFEL